MPEHKKSDIRGLVYFLIGAAYSFLCFAVTCAVLMVSGKITVLPVLFGGIALAAGNLLIAYFSLQKRETPAQTASEENKQSPIGQAMSEVMKNLSIPASISDIDGNLIWCNTIMRGILSATDFHGGGIERLTGHPIADFIRAEGSEGLPVTMNGKPYSATSYMMPGPERDFWMTFFEDRTALEAAASRLEAESPVVVYAVLDNIDQVNQFVRSSFREDTNRIENVLSSWVKELDGFIREYDRDRYMILFPKKRLRDCVENGFSVLGDIRNIGSESGTLLTVSMGVSECGATLREREENAAAALETALQRGGDQVVLRDRSSNVAYYGGKTKSEISRTRIGTRTAAVRLVQLISEAGNVLIMGHAKPDYDSIGGCVGLYRLASAFHPTVRIVMDRENSNFRTSAEALLREQPEYDRIFISGEEGMEQMRSDTLLILADVNNMEIVECRDIAAGAAQLVIVDHHRKAAEFVIPPELSVIEPGTSSCCELVSEMLEFTAEGNPDLADKLLPRPAEATVMLSGIMLDTKNFTRTTGEETFAAAMYLRSHGAALDAIRSFFHSNGESGFICEARLSSGMKRFRDRIALAAESVPAVTGEEQISASRVAESLLSVKDIDASFVMCYSDSCVLISARSNGKINVQLILENLGGGGRYDAAGARVEGKSFHVVSEMLKEAIDAFLDSEESADAR